MKIIDIVMPVYNEEAVLAVFHASLSRIINKLADKYRLNVVYVLDRSTDNSIEVLRQIHKQDPRVTVLHLSRRFGHQMSLVAGIDHSRADALIMMDCDLQHPPELIPEMLRKFEEGYEIVQALRKDDVHNSYVKRSLSRAFYAIQNALSPVEIEAGSADYRLITRKVIDVFQKSIREHNQFLRGLFQWVGFPTAYLTFVCPQRAGGTSKYGLSRSLLFSIAGITSFSKVPLRIATFLGFGFSAMSMFYGLWLVIMYFLVGRFPPGYASMIVAILGMGGLQLIVLGIIGEYLGGVFDEVKRRPLYIVSEKIAKDEWDVDRFGTQITQSSVIPGSS
jgi:glycosyltransferase involved in cell wall biosynthesis